MSWPSTRGAVPGKRGLKGPAPPAATRLAAAIAVDAGKDLPAQTGRQVALDGLRAAAAFAILMIHVGGVTGLEFNGAALSWVISRGDIGVAIFFALSGLLIYRPWAKAALSGTQPPSVPRYLWRRALRILPAYWVVVVIAFLTLGVAGRPIWGWPQYLLLAQNYDPHPWWRGTGAVGLEQTWSLGVEASFYLLLPTIAAALTWSARRGGANVDRRARRLLTGIGLIGACSYGWIALAYYPRPQLWLLDTLPRVMTWFAVGMAIAVVSAWAHADERHDSPVRNFCGAVATWGGAFWLLGALVFLIACTQLTGPEGFTVPSVWQSEAKTGLYTVVVVALVAPVAFQPQKGARFGALLANPVMRFLGKISYGIFLWQFLVIYAFLAVLRLRDVFHGGHYGIPAAVSMFALVAALTVAAATVSYYALEQPAQRLYHVGRSEVRAARPSNAARHSARRRAVPGSPGDESLPGAARGDAG